MSSVQTLIQIFLELALVSTVRVKGFTPTIHTAATIKLVCEYVPNLYPFIDQPSLTRIVIPQSYGRCGWAGLLCLPSSEDNQPHGHPNTEMVLVSFT
jgi:hypothetical protein